MIEANHEIPYLGLRLTFDYRDISQVMADSQLPPPRAQKTDIGMATGDLIERHDGIPVAVKRIDKLEKRFDEITGNFLQGD